jgi:hypothetical protein
MVNQGYCVEDHTSSWFLSLTVRFALSGLGTNTPSRGGHSFHLMATTLCLISSNRTIRAGTMSI